MEEYRRLADQPATSARKQGDARKAIDAAAHKISASYEFPYLAHAPMEPLDAVVKLDATSCEIWTGDQFQTLDQANAAQTAGLDPQKVIIHTLYAGGSFGRRANVISDYIVEAVSIANSVEYGLTASVFTRDLRTAIAFSRDIEAGYVWVNETSRHFIGAPFGGVKNSGVGREEDISEIESYTQVKNINMRFS